MNDLVTPPGYVEYPRDPKFRALDTAERLEMVASGLRMFRWWAFLFPIALIVAASGAVHLPVTIPIAIGFLTACCVYFSMWPIVAKIFKGAGRSRFQLICFIGWPAVVAFLLQTRLLQFSSAYVGLIGSLVLDGLLTYVMVYEEFNKHDRNLAFWLPDRRLKQIIERVSGYAEGVLQA